MWAENQRWIIIKISCPSVHTAEHRKFRILQSLRLIRWPVTAGINVTTLKTAVQQTRLTDECGRIIPVEKSQNVAFFILRKSRNDPLLRTQPTSLSSPEPVVSWSRGRETRGYTDTGRLQIKPSGSGDENEPISTAGGRELSKGGSFLSLVLWESWKATFSMLTKKDRQSFLAWSSQRSSALNIGGLVTNSILGGIPWIYYYQDAESFETQDLFQAKSDESGTLHKIFY